MFKKKIIYLFSSNWLAKFENFLIFLGSFWLGIEFPSFLIKPYEDFVKSNSIEIFVWSIIFSVLFALIRDWPKSKITKQFKASNTSICIKVGDVFKENKNIAIGSSDYFDTTFRRTDISLKSQMINLYFPNITVLDNFINDSLNQQNIQGVIDVTRQGGKNIKYELGTVAVIPAPQKRFFLTVITNLIYNIQGTTTKSSPEKLNQGLNGLWNRLKIEGRMEEISIPILGSGLAGVTLSRLMLIQSIILSYSIFAKETRISTKLNLIIAEKDFDPDDFQHACKFLESIQF